MGIYKVTKVSRGASRSSEAVCQQAPLHCSRRPPSVAHWDSLAPVRGEGGRRPGGTGDGSAMGDAVAASNEVLEALAKRAIALNGQWQKAKT